MYFAKCPRDVWGNLLAFCHSYQPETIGGEWGYEWALSSGWNFLAGESYR